MSAKIGQLEKVVDIASCRFVIRASAMLERRMTQLPKWHGPKWKSNFPSTGTGEYKILNTTPKKVPKRNVFIVLSITGQVGWFSSFFSFFFSLDTLRHFLHSLLNDSFSSFFRGRQRRPITLFIYYTGYVYVWNVT